MRGVRTPAKRGKAGGRFYPIMGERSGPATRLQVTDLFFLLALRFFPHRTENLGKSSMSGVTRASYRPLRSHNNCGRRPRMDTAPKYLICDHDGKFGPCFAHVASNKQRSRFLKHHITRLVPMPSVNAFWGVFGESAWIYILILSEKQLHRVLRAYVEYLQSGTTSTRHSAAGSGKGSHLRSISSA